MDNANVLAIVVRYNERLSVTNDIIQQISEVRVMNEAVGYMQVTTEVDLGGNLICRFHERVTKSEQVQKVI